MGLQTPQAQLLNIQNQHQDQDPSKGRPLLLEEQPLLLQDLLDQERQEQQQQKQMQALIRHRATPETVVPNMGRTLHIGGHCRMWAAPPHLPWILSLCVGVCVQQTLIPSQTPS